MDAVVLSTLIESIYDCTIDPALWPSTLEQIAWTLDSAAGTLNVIDFVTGAEQTLVHAGISGEYQDLYANKYQGCNIFAHHMWLQPIDQPATSDELVSEAELLGSRIYREWAAPQGFRHVMLTTLIRTQARMAFIGVTRRACQPRYTAEDKAYMSLLVPHVRRALTIADLIEHKSAERDDLAATLDALTTAVLVLGNDRRLVYANAAGGKLLAREDLLLTRTDAVEPWDRSAATAFRAMIIAASGGTITLARREGGRALVSTLPLRGRRRQFPAPSSARLALFVQDDPCGPHAIEGLERFRFNLVRILLRRRSWRTCRA